MSARVTSPGEERRILREQRAARRAGLLTRKVEPVADEEPETATLRCQWCPNTLPFTFTDDEDSAREIAMEDAGWRMIGLENCCNECRVIEPYDADREADEREACH